ncbi:tape measure protein [Bifidobacterium longum]|uniref:phage tail protein n=1 Tax=Bifidobacterium longum TaxID=216816 RepID=UPI00257084F8|nr:tape measure protein [Bifidobacterium longum]MDL5509320.1 tape measure protein [Bifidobacterium longum]
MAESSIGVVYIEVAPSGKDFGKKLEGDIIQAVDNAAKTGGTSILGKFGGAFGKIGKVGLGAIGTIAGGITALAAKGGFQRALNIENAQAKLKGLGHDSKSIAEIMNNALASVKGTAFGLGDAATVAATLSAAGIKSGDQMTNVLKTVADTAQISGRSLTDIGTIFSSVAARGKLQGDDMLQLMSSGVPVLQLLAKHLGKTSEEVSDMVSKGKIDFQTFADSMQEGLGGAALAAGDTFSGALANVKAALSRLGEGPGKLALESLRKTFNAAIPAVDALSSQLTPFVEQLNGKLTPYADRAVKLIEQFSQGLQDGSITVQDIVGSLGQLAGAFALFAGVGGNVDKITNVFDTLGNMVGPKVQTGLGKIGSLFGSFFSPGNFMKYMGIAGIIAALVAGLGMLDQSMQGQLFAMIGQLSAQLPTLLQQLNMQITASLPAMLAQGAAILTALMNAISTNAPQLMTTAVLIVTTLVNGLASQLPTLLPAALNMIMALVNGLASNAGQLLNSGMQLLLGLAQGLMNALPQLIAQAPTIIGNLVQSIAANLPQILQTGVKILVTLANGLASAIPQLIGKIPAIVRSIWNGFTSVNWGEVGMNIITGIASGVTSAAGKLVDAAVGAAKDALNWVKDKLGIHSPSRVFRDQVGVMIGRGMAEGIDQSQRIVNRSLDRIAAGLTLDDHSFGSPSIGTIGGGTGMLRDGNEQASMQTALLEQLLAALVALHADIPTMLQALGVEVDGREVGRLIRKYANA